MGRVAGKVALITGAAGGQGRANALRLASEGADVIAIDIARPVPTSAARPTTEQDLAETAQGVRAQGRRVSVQQADVRDHDGLHAAVLAGVAELGRLDIVLANAGIASFDLATDLTEQQWSTLVDINLSGVWRTLKAAAPHLVAQGDGGSIIIMGSSVGLKPGPATAHYGAAKAGLNALARTFAHELAPHFIRVNTVNPTFVRTPMIDNAATRGLFRPDLENPTLDDTADSFQSANLLPIPWVEPEDVANAVLWLASDEARYITGIALPVDAGYSIK